jgi:arylsulfatase A-like enzyme
MSKHPNIILTIADDQRFDTIAAHGNRQIITPNLDRLAERGTSYRRAQHGGSSHGAVCAPSRAQLHTGRHLWATSDSLDTLRRPITNQREANQNRPHVTLGQHLQKAGYDAFAVGKWHNGEASFLRSFQGAKLAMFEGMSAHFCVRAHDLPTGSGKIGPRYGVAGHSTDVYAGAAVDFLRQRSRSDERPFFLYVAFTAPHDPRETHWRFRRQYDAKTIHFPTSFAPQHPFEIDGLNGRDECLAEFPRQLDEARMHEADYYAMITHLDEGLGRIHHALQEVGQADNTIVVHTADHGLGLGRHGLMGKQSVYDHSIRVPLVVAGPGFEAGADDERLCHQHDLFPTLLNAAGVKRFATDFIDLHGTRRKYITCAYAQGMRSIRDERMKLIEYRHPTGSHTQLFDTHADPHEVNDLSVSPSHKATLRRLRAALRRELPKEDPILRNW